MAGYISPICEGPRVASSQFDCAPILLIGFNRPDYMAAQIAAIRDARPQKLYFAVDGPRAGRPGEADLCRQVRECAALIDWPCEVKTLFREANLGCKYGVSGAITWFFENETEGIILEDDCRPTIDFLRFATELLERYRDNERIGAVSAMNLYDMQTDRAVSYHFNTHVNVWGWATWRRAWQHFNPNGQELLDELKRRKLTRRFDFNGKYGFTRMLRRQIEGKNNSWAIRWNASLFLADILSLNVGRSLVQNEGFDGSGTNCGNDGLYASNLWTKPLPVEKIQPIEENELARNAFEKYYARTNSFYAKALRRFKRTLKGDFGA